MFWSAGDMLKSCSCCTLATLLAANWGQERTNGGKLEAPVPGWLRADRTIPPSQNTPVRDLSLHCFQPISPPAPWGRSAEALPGKPPLLSALVAELGASPCRRLTSRSPALALKPGRPSPAATPQPDRSTRRHNAEKQRPAQLLISRPKSRRFSGDHCDQGVYQIGLV
jgi:hypothetical protein